MTQSIFSRPRRSTRTRSALSMLTLVFHLAAQNVRSSGRNALLGLVSDVFRSVMMIGMFFLMTTFMGRSMISAIRGDFILYLMSGVMMYMAFNKSFSAVQGAQQATSSMMKHSPMTTSVGILSAALGALYSQMLSVLTLLTVYHCAWTPVHIDQPAEVAGMFLLAWFSGASFGLVFYAAKPWNPWLFSNIGMIYRRINVFASGKMFVANTLPAVMVSMFDWNPLFHIIDQARGYAFINYYPRNSNIDYPIIISVSVLVMGMMIEFLTRRSQSLSWGARSEL